MSQTRCRNICFTWNNYPDDWKTTLSSLPIQFCVVGFEVAPTTGTKHLQGYIQFSRQVYFSTIKKSLPTVHFEVARGSFEDNIKYCSKSGEVEKWGEPKTDPSQAVRTDLLNIKNSILSGSSMATVLPNITNLQQLTFAEKLMKYSRVVRKEMPDVIWIYGPSGVGKSRKALEMAGDDAYWWNGSQWWDGYDNHEVVIIDDFRPNHPLDYMLRLFDRYPLSLPVKGSHVNMLAKRFIVTSIHPPSSMYRILDEPPKQLLRRIKEIIFLQDNIKIEDAIPIYSPCPPQTLGASSDDSLEEKDFSITCSHS